MRGTPRYVTNAVAVAAAFVVLGLLSGCGGSVTVERSELSSGLRPAPESPQDGGNDDTGPGGGTTDPIPLPSVPGPEQLDTCAEMATAFAGLAAGTIGGPESLQEAIGRLDAVRDQFPEDVQDDLDTVIDAYRRITTEGVLDGSDALTTPEFQDAFGRVLEALQEQCGVPDSGGGAGGPGVGGASSD